MGSKRVMKIVDNYAFYTSLVEGRKSIFTDVIEVNNVGNNVNILEKVEPAKHLSIGDSLTFTVNVKLKNHNFFQFKLRNQAFCPQHFFRYDSDGDTHRNKIDGIPLKDQSIPTPHFHKYHENGYEIAYQTEALLNYKERKALEDINLCLKHFFHESNLRLNKEDFSDVVIMSNTLGLSLSSVDPNANIIFP